MVTTGLESAGCNCGSRRTTIEATATGVWTRCPTCKRGKFTPGASNQLELGAGATVEIEVPPGWGVEEAPAEAVVEAGAVDDGVEAAEGLEEGTVEGEDQCDVEAEPTEEELAASRVKAYSFLVAHGLVEGSDGDDGDA
jgi:hypothetical protein